LGGGDGVEEIELLVSGEGNPISWKDAQSAESIQALRESPRGVFLAYLLGQHLFDDFVRDAEAEAEDTDWAFGGSLTLEDLRVFSEVFGVPLESVKIRAAPHSGLLVCGKKTRTAEEIAAARRPYEDALARYERDLAAYEQFEQEQARKLLGARDEKYSFKPDKVGT
jgi:hypothetical protein